MPLSFSARRTLAVLAAVACLASVAGCHRNKNKLPAPGSVEPDQFLYDRGIDLLVRKHWIEAREYFRRLVDTFPGSTYRCRAKIGVGESYLGEKSVESNILAVNEYREFLAYCPLSENADYGQYRLAVGLMRQMLAPERDQTATRDALKELDKFLENYPNSTYRPDVLKARREVRDRLSDSEFDVGHYYFRTNWCPGALDRMRVILVEDPDYSRRDAVYYEMGSCLVKVGLKDQAVPLFQKILDDFKKSKYRGGAQKQLSAIKK